MSPAQVDPGSPLLTPEKREDTRREERVPTWRTLSPFVKDHVENVCISEYPQKNRTRSRVAMAAQRPGATANAVRQNCPMGNRETAMEMTPSPVRRMFSVPSDSKGYHTCYPSDDAGTEPDFLAGRPPTVPNPEPAHDAERESLPLRAPTTIVPRHTGDGEEVRIDSDATGDRVMG